MTAKRESIFAAIEAALNTLSGVATVERMAAGEPSAFPALLIEDTGQQIIPGEVGSTRYLLPVVIEGYVESDAATAHAALNALYLDVVTKLLADPPLGGLADEISEGAMRVAVAVLASKRRLGFSLDIQIEFSADRENPAG